jgi:hypothetical protein
LGTHKGRERAVLLLEDQEPDPNPKETEKQIAELVEAAQQGTWIEFALAEKSQAQQKRKRRNRF